MMMVEIHSEIGPEKKNWNSQPKKGPGYIRKKITAKKRDSVALRRHSIEKERRAPDEGASSAGEAMSPADDHYPGAGAANAVTIGRERCDS